MLLGHAFTLVVNLEKDIPSIASVGGALFSRLLAFIQITVGLSFGLVWVIVGHSTAGEQ